MNEQEKYVHTQDILKKATELNELLDIAARNNLIINYNVDCDGHVRLLTAKSTVTYYDYEER